MTINSNSLKVHRILKIILRLPVYFLLYIKGIIYFRWDRLIDDFYNDFVNFKNTSLKQKLWAYKRGFLSERISRYGLNENNYTNYLSDFEFYKKHMYKNRRFSFWFDDKLTTWYILQPYKEYLPKHYYSIENNEIRQLYRDGSQVNNNVNGIIYLLQQNNKLAFKQTRGGHGEGFFRITYDNKHYYVNSEMITLSELKLFIESLNHYLITDYIEAHKSLKIIYEKAPSVLRLITIYDEKKESQVTGSLIRFGTKKSGFTTDIAGTIYCGVRLDDGTFFKPMIDLGNTIEPCPIHPDTGVKIEGLVPNWNKIINKAIEISNYLNNTPYMTYDIVPTDGSFKILEINSHAITRILQPFYPFYANEYQRKLFLE